MLVSWNCGFMFFMSLGKFSAIIYSRIAFPTFSLISVLGTFVRYLMFLNFYFIYLSLFLLLLYNFLTYLSVQ